MIAEETRGHARILRFDRPEKRNALSKADVLSLADHLRAAGADPSVRGVILAAAPSPAERRVFVAGGDLDEIAALYELGGDAGADAIIEVGQALDAIDACAVPVVAAVAGDTLGGGCELVLRCDAVFAESHARFSFKHAAMGLSPAWGGAHRLVLRLGLLRAKELLFTARAVLAEEAFAMGLVTEIAQHAEARALAFIDTVAAHDRTVIASQKRLLQQLAAATLDPALAASLQRTTLRSLFGVGANERVLLAHRERRAKPG